MTTYAISARVDEDEQLVEYSGTCQDCGYTPEGTWNSISNLDARLFRHVTEECGKD